MKWTVLLLFFLITACSIDQEVIIEESWNDSINLSENVDTSENDPPEFNETNNSEILLALNNSSEENYIQENEELIDSEPYIEVKIVEINDGELFYQYTITNPSSSTKEVTHGVRKYYNEKFRPMFIPSGRTLTFSDIVQVGEGTRYTLKIFFEEDIYEYNFNERGLLYSDDYGSFDDLAFDIRFLRETQKNVLFEVIFQNKGTKTLAININSKEVTPFITAGSYPSAGGGYLIDIFLAPGELYVKEVELAKSDSKGDYSLTYSLKNARNQLDDSFQENEVLEKTGYYTTK